MLNSVENICNELQSVDFQKDTFIIKMISDFVRFLAVSCDLYFVLFYICISNFVFCYKKNLSLAGERETNKKVLIIWTNALEDFSLGRATSQ